MNKAFKRPSRVIKVHNRASKIKMTKKPGIDYNKQIESVIIKSKQFSDSPVNEMIEEEIEIMRISSKEESKKLRVSHNTGANTIKNSENTGAKQAKESYRQR
jgi:hypothetical protein